MAHAHLVITERINSQVIDKLEERLKDNFDLDERQEHFRRAVEVPQYVHLITSSPFWTFISVGAVLFLKKTVELSAEDFYDSIKKRFKNNSKNTIEDITNHFLTAQDESEPSFDISFRLVREKNDYYGVSLYLDRDDPIAFATNIARFSLAADQLNKFLEENTSVLGDAHIRFISDNEAVLEWTDQNMEKNSQPIFIDFP